MRIGRTRECGELLMFEEVRRRLNLRMPQFESDSTISVSDIVGTVGRAGDFDGCFRPRGAHLAQRISQIRDKNPDALNQPIEVVRVDRAYFVVDGHKRVSIGKSGGMEFIDARVSSVAGQFELAPDVEPQSIDLTARELQFRDETGLMTAVPAARFAVSKPEAIPSSRRRWSPTPTSSASGWAGSCRGRRARRSGMSASIGPRSPQASMLACPS